jgi:hypothetical protein
LFINFQKEKEKKNDIESGKLDFQDLKSVDLTSKKFSQLASSTISQFSL